MLRVSAAASAPSRDHPFRAGLQARLLQDQFQADPGPFGATQQADEIGRRLAIGLLVDRIAGAFEEMDARLRGKTPDVIPGEDQRLVDKAMEHQPVLRRINRGNPAVMAFVEQSVRRDDAVEILQRRPPGRGDILRQIFRNVLDDPLLERRWRAVELLSHGSAGRFHPFRNIRREVVGIVRSGGRQNLAAGETAEDGPAHQCAALA